jgi:hypothetical protein
MKPEAIEFYTQTKVVALRQMASYKGNNRGDKNIVAIFVATILCFSEYSIFRL